MSPTRRNRATVFESRVMVELLLRARMKFNRSLAWDSQKMFRKWNVHNEESAPWR
jgi:hypothetical protein